MTILSLDTQRDIFNAAMSSIHYIAFEMKCETADVIAIINARREADITGEVPRDIAPASHSPETATENAPDPAQAGETRNSPAPNPVQDTLAPPPSGGPDASDAAQSDEAGEVIAPPKVASPAPMKRGRYKSKHETMNNRVRAAYEANPGITSRQLAAVMGEDIRRVQDALARIRLPVRRPNAQEMSAILAASKGETTKQRILALIAAEPDLLREQVAERVNVRHQYVLRVCRMAGVRCPPLTKNALQPTAKPKRMPYAGAEPDDDPPPVAIEARFTPSGWVATPAPRPARPEARKAPLTASEIAAIEARRREEAERVAKAIRPEPPREPDAAPKIVQPKSRAKFFRMKDKATGLYLHWSAEQMTNDVAQAWRGTAAQVQGCKRAYAAMAAKLMVVTANDAPKSAGWM